MRDRVFRGAMFWSIVTVAPLAPAVARAQPRPVTVPRDLSRREDKVSITVDLTVGGTRHQATVNGYCRHAPRAALSGQPVREWSVDVEDAGSAGSLNLSLWQLTADNSTQLQLSVGTPPKPHRLSTMKLDVPTGSGTVTVTPSGAGGRFDVDGKAGDGATIKGTIDCKRWTMPTAVGG